MNYESRSSPFPFPEIIHDHTHPPQLVDIEIQQEPFHQLIMALSRRRPSDTHKIAIIGGLIRLGEKPYEQVYRSITTNSELNRLNLFSQIYCEQSIGGSHSTHTKQLSLHPDTIFLNLIAQTVISQDGHINSNELVPIAQSNLPQAIARTFIEELEHNFQTGKEIISLLARFGLEKMPIQLRQKLVKAKRNDVQLQTLALQSIQQKILIGKQELAEICQAAITQYIKIALERFSPQKNPALRYFHSQLPD